MKKKLKRMVLWLAVVLGGAGCVTSGVKDGVDGAAQTLEGTYKDGAPAGDERTGQAAVNLRKVQELIGKPETPADASLAGLRATGKELDADIEAWKSIKGFWTGLVKSYVPHGAVALSLLAAVGGMWRKGRKLFNAGTRIAGKLNDAKHNFENLRNAVKGGKLKDVPLASVETALTDIKDLGREGVSGYKEIKGMFDAMKKAAAPPKPDTYA